MTPLLRRIYAHMSHNPEHPQYKTSMAEFTEALCFEVTRVTPLVQETVNTLAKSSFQTLEGHTHLSHGGLLVMPHNRVWLEWVSPPVGDKPSMRIGIYLYTLGNEDLINVECTTSKEIEYGERFGISASHLGRIYLYPDETCRVVSVGDPSEEQLGGMAGLSAVALLLILNAPYGIAKPTQPVHKTHAKEAQRHGFKLKPHHIVYLDKSRPPPDQTLHDITYNSGPKFHKAFHFVRTHLRHFKDGTHTKIKAHWRGDPRLGICPHPDYKVRP